MKSPRRIIGCWIACLSMLGMGLLFTGCHSTPAFSDVPGMPAPSTGKSDLPSTGKSDIFQVGDQVGITFSGANPDQSQPIQPYQETIKEDGTITPPFIGPVTAAGKSPGELQKELQAKYDKIYRNMTVTVQPKERYYYVSGEVRKPGPEPYLGKTDIIKAISAAGDFTDFGNKKNVRLWRNGESQTINVQKIIDGDAKDVEIFPGDRILVKRRWF